MGWLGKLLGLDFGNMAEGVANAIDKFVETPEEKKAAELILMKAQQDPDKWQIEINKIEAGHRSIFVAGWRPAVGWVCVSALAWGWIVAPVIKVVSPTTELPAIELGQAISLIMTMLGMSALRSYEKKNHITN